MSVKTTGAEFKRFYDDKVFWPDEADTYHEDVMFTIDGVLQEDIDPSTLADEAIVKIDGGIVFFATGGGEPTMETYFRRWLKQQNTASFVVECDRAMVDAVKAAIKAAGGRVAS